MKEINIAAPSLSDAFLNVHAVLRLEDLKKILSSREFSVLSRIRAVLENDALTDAQCLLEIRSLLLEYEAPAME